MVEPAAMVEVAAPAERFTPPHHRVQRYRTPHLQAISQVAVVRGLMERAVWSTAAAEMREMAEQ